MSEKHKRRSDNDIREDLTKFSGIGRGGRNRLVDHSTGFISSEAVGDLDIAERSVKTKTPTKKAT